MTRFDNEESGRANPYARLGCGAALGALLGFLFETHGLADPDAVMIERPPFLDVEFGLISGFSAILALLWVEERRRRFYPVPPTAAFAASLHLAFVICLSIGQEFALMSRRVVVIAWPYRGPTPSRLALIDGLLSAALCGGAVVAFHVFVEPRLRRGVRQGR